MFIDELTINIYAGKGGDGVVSWMHEKGKDHAGPGGGDGGDGGDVYLCGVRDIGRLSEYKFIKDFKAGNGQNGLSDCMRGKSGSDLVIELPIGSVVTDTETGQSTEVLSEEKIFFLKGGRGGYGNAHFKGPENQRPKEFTAGKPAQGGCFFVELKLLVDVGLVGLPNAGKSSILNSLTKANAKVGNYQFTTLTPNLGDFYGYIIADIPGLIEGASEGRGLGHKFLRHVSRTKMILHCVSLESSDISSDYDTIRKELEEYGQNLSSKKEVVVLTKSDSVTAKELKEKIKIMKSKNKNVLSVSILDDDSLKKFKDDLVKILRKM